jgi:hypothetical protein
MTQLPVPVSMLSVKHEGDKAMSSYMIVYLRDGREVASTPWSGDLASAEQHAREHLTGEKNQHDATSVQVIDVGTKKFVYWYSGEG